MAVSLGNQLIGNGLYLGNQNYRDSNVFMSQSAVVQSYVTSGLVFYVDAGVSTSYPGTGASWYDLSTNAITASLVNTPTFSSTSGSYFEFNGSNQYATFTPQLAAGDATYSYFVVTSPNVNQTKMVLYQGTEAANQRGAMIMCSQADSGITNGAFGFNGYNNDSIQGCGGAVQVSLGTWQTFSFTLDEVAAIPFNLYKNGVLSRSGSSTGGATNLNLGTSAGRIAANGSNGENYNGKIAVCMMYNRTLTAAEITQNHNYFASRYSLAQA